MECGLLRTLLGGGTVKRIDVFVDISDICLKIL